MEILNGGRITLYRKNSVSKKIKEVVLNKTFFDLSYFLEDVDVNYQLIVHYDNYSMMFRLYKDFFSVNLSDKLKFLLEENSNGPNTFKPVLGSNIRPNKIILNQVEKYNKFNEIDVIPLVNKNLNDDEFFFLEIHSLEKDKPFYEIGISEFGVFLDSNTNCLDVRGLKTNYDSNLSKNSLSFTPNNNKDSDHAHLLFQRVMHNLEIKKHSHDKDYLNKIKNSIAECFLNAKPIPNFINGEYNLVNLTTTALIAVLGEYKKNWYLNQIIYSEISKQYQLFFTYDLDKPKTSFIILNLEDVNSLINN